MCPFCIATSVWIAAGAVTTGVSALAATKLITRKSPAKTESQERSQQ